MTSCMMQNNHEIREFVWLYDRIVNLLNYSSRMSVINNELTCLATNWLRAAQRPSAIGVVRRIEGVQSDATQLDAELSWVVSL